MNADERRFWPELQDSTCPVNSWGTTLVLAQLVLLCGLRQLTGRLTMELKTMGATIDIAKNEILRDLMRDGQASIIRIQLETKFGKLPKWVDERLGHATLSDVARWSKKLLTAETLEGVLGKK